MSVEALPPSLPRLMVEDAVRAALLEDLGRAGDREQTDRAGAYVFMLGVLVAFVKLGNMATMHTGVSLYAFGLLIIVLAAASSSFDARLLWRAVARRRYAVRQTWHDRVDRGGRGRHWLRLRPRAPFPLMGTK